LQRIQRNLQRRRDLPCHLLAQGFERQSRILDSLGPHSLVSCCPNVDHAAIGVGKGHHVTDDRMQGTASPGHVFMKGLHQRGALRPRRLHIVKGLCSAAVGARPSEIVAQKQLLERGKAQLGEEHLRRPFSHPGVLALPGDAMGIRALDAVHPARILRLAAIEKGGRVAAPCRTLQIGHFQRVEVRILGIGDTRLPAKANAEHGDAMGRVCMRGDHQRSRLGQHLISGNHVHRGPDLRLALF